MNDEILLSVVVLTYNHERYITESLDSIMMQQTTFNYEVLVSDDASSDATQNILKEYVKRNPNNRIKLRLGKKNVGATKNTYGVCKKAKGKYIAFLEGDDYWTDNKKLQKQVDFLEKNGKYIGVVHKCRIVNERGVIYPAINNDDWYCTKGEYDVEKFETGILPGQTGTLVFRNIFHDTGKDYSILYKAHGLIGDKTIYALLVELGTIYCMDETMGCYRYVNRRNARNATALALYNNTCWEMWKYYHCLEKYFKKDKHKIKFSVQKKRELHRAINFMKENINNENAIILMKLYIACLLF